MPDSKADALLVQYLADHDAPCPVCSYNLRGLTAEKCPECGERLGLALRAMDQRFGPWIAALIGASCGLGFYLAIGGLYLWMVLWAGWTPRRTGIDVIALLIGLGVSGGIELLLLLFARQFRRLVPGVAWTLAAICWMISAASCIVFLIFV